MSQIDPSNLSDPSKNASEKSDVNPRDGVPNAQMPPKRTRKRKRWLMVLAGLVVLLMLFVLLIPTIAGFGFVRSIVVGKVNDNLNGHVEIDDWSLGWFGGVTVRGVRVFDDGGKKIASIDKLTTGLSLIDAIRGKYNLGKTSVDGLDFLLTVDENGQTNFDRLAKTTATAKKPKEHSESALESKEPAKLPDVTGDFSVSGKGEILVAGKPAHHVKSLQASATITSINDPIKHQANIQFALGDGPTCTVDVGGTVSAIKNNLVDRDHLSADDELKLSNIDISAANAFIGKNLTLAGIAKGDIKIKVTGPTSGAIDGSLGIDNAMAGGDALKGDTYKTNLNIPVNISSDGNALTITTLNVEGTHFAARVNGKLGIAALQNIVAKKSPGANGGSLDVHVSAPDLAPIVSQLTHAIALLPDVQVKSGVFEQNTHLDIRDKDVAIHNDLSFSAAGTKAGQPIAISKVEIKKVDTTFDPTKQSLAGLANVGLDLSSPFLTVTGGGTSLSKLNIKGNLDLTQLRQQLAQFVDLKELQIQGTGTFALTSTGDVTAANQPLAATANVALSNFALTLPGKSPIKLDSLNLTANATVNQASGTLDRGDVTLQTTDGGKTIVDLAANAQNFDPKSQSVGHFQIVKCTVSDLKTAQQQIDPFVPALAANGIRISAGQLYTDVSGSFDGKTMTVKLDKPLEVSTPNLTIQKVDAAGVAQDVVRDEKITIAAQGDASLPPDGTLSADIKTLSVQTDHDIVKVSKDDSADFTVKRDAGGNIAGNGKLMIAADLKALSDIANRFKPPTTEPTTEPADKTGQLTSGLLDTTVALSHADKPETVAQITGSIKNLSITTADPKHPISNETVNLSIGARTDDKFSAASANGKIDSSFGTVNLNSVQVLLTDPQTGKPAGTWEMLQKADIAIALQDLVKVQGLINAFTPAADTKSQANALNRFAIPPSSLVDGLLADDSSGSAPNASTAKKKKPKTAHPDANSATPIAADTEPAVPIQVTSGSLNLALTVSRNTAQKTTDVSVTDMSITKLAIQRGSHQYAFDQTAPITFKLAAQVGAADDASKTLVQQISAVKISTLQGDLRVATLSMPTPITITNLADKPQANGAIAVSGKLDALTPLLATMQQSNELPYGGDFALTENVASHGDQIGLVGNITANQFTVYNVDANGKKTTTAAFTEPQVAIKNDLAVNPTTSDATINTLTVDMPQSHAVGVQLTGAMHDYLKQRTLDNIKLDLSYDLAKVWPIVHPMLLTPGQPDQYKDLVVQGVIQKTFHVSGSYPAIVGAQPAQWWQSIATVNADGGVGMRHFEYKGVTLDNFDLPITITNGLLKTPASSAGAAGAAAPSPQAVTNGGPANGSTNSSTNAPSAAPTTAPTSGAICNGGTLDLGDIALDLGQEDPVLSIAKNHRLTRGIKLNPVMADAVGSETLLFKDASTASGLLDVTIVECKSVPLGDLIAKRPNAKAQVTFSITKLNLDAPAPQVVATALQLGDQGIQGEIKDGKMTLENGQVTSDFSIQVMQYKKAKKSKNGSDVDNTTTPQGSNTLGDTGAAGAAAGQIAQQLPLHFSGGVDLSTQALKNFAVNIPAALIPDTVTKLFGSKVDLTKVFPNGLTVPFTGTTSSFKFDLQKALLANGPANLLNGGGGGAQDGLQNLINGLGNKKKKDKNSQ